MDKEDIELAQSTPLMRRWWEIKSGLDDDEIVFCRVGDFYELFFDDAERAADILDLQLTHRKSGGGKYPMAGVPYRSVETYISRLVEKGYKVAVVDQLEDAKQSSGMVKRGLTRIVTAGTITEENMLDPGENNYLAAISHKKSGRTTEYGIAFCDLSTGDFRAGAFQEKDRDELLRGYSKFAPVEIIHNEEVNDIISTYGIPLENDEVITEKPSFWFDPDNARKIVFEQFDVETVEGFGLGKDSPAVGAAGALLKYLQETQFTSFPHLSAIRSLDIKETMMLDATAIRSLELFENTQDHTEHATLLNLMDETTTAMGGRLLRHWMANPLAQPKKIENRLSTVTLFKENPLLQHKTRSNLDEMGDIERLMTRISIGSARPDELINLAESMEAVPDLLDLLNRHEDTFPEGLLDEIDPCPDLVALIRKTIKDEPSNEVGEGDVIAEGYNSELDRLRTIMDEGEQWIETYIEEEKEKTGIDSYKIKSNNALGYYIDISKKELDKVPDHYQRKQVMVNTTRFYTDDLKDWETEIIEAEINILELEQKLYDNILDQLTNFTDIIQQTGKAIAAVDCLSSFAYLADRRNYCRPELKQDKSLKIYGGRHPVIEALNPTEEYVPNDIIMDYEEERILIITGPNFSGKSSLLRATALIVIMAQMGSFVPADHVEMGYVDRIFTRIGASDNLVAGQSTFMIEMIDAANLVNNSTDRSLVIADELGRGTSTYDGLAIAWSITEYLHNKDNSPKTLIATHYHQLSELEDVLDAVKNYQFLIGFEGDDPVFDHKLEPGSSDKSFGVEVAKLAGLPDEVIERGRMILGLLEDRAAEVDPSVERAQRLAELIIAEDGQSSLENWFSGGQRQSQHIEKRKKQEKTNNGETKIDPIVEKLKDVDIEQLTPVESLNILAELKDEIAQDD